MRVELAKLKPNPYRDFLIDPVDGEMSKHLIASIHESGFWGGSSLRQNEKGEFEIACGHTRIYAAIDAGITHADLHVRKYNAEQMIRMYATENATQRNGEKSGLAMAGAVASAVRYLLKGILKGDEHVRKIFLTSEGGSERGLDTIKGQIASEKGLGYDCVLRFFEGIPSMNIGIVKYQLGNLKASGEYARIVKEVNDEIAQEQAEERAELERREAEAKAARKTAEEARKRAIEAKKRAAAKAADKAAKEAAAKAAKEAEARAIEAEEKQAEAEAQVDENVKKTRDASEKAVENSGKRKITFDLKGVGKYLKSEHQLRVFRTVVERENIKRHIPVSAQEKLAALLVKYANQHNKGELTGTFIERYLTEIVKNTANLRKGGDLDLELTPEVLTAIEYENAQHRFTKLSHHFCRNWAGVITDANDMIKLKDQYPDLNFTITKELRMAVRFATTTIDNLIEKFNLQK
jgi:regulator of protease activity HflC (stomatin/prohibitin superfamily)